MPEDELLDYVDVAATEPSESRSYEEFDYKKIVGAIPGWKIYTEQFTLTA